MAALQALIARSIAPLTLFTKQPAPALSLSFLSSARAGKDAASATNASKATNGCVGFISYGHPGSMQLKSADHRCMARRATLALPLHRDCCSEAHLEAAVDRKRWRRRDRARVFQLRAVGAGADRGTAGRAQRVGIEVGAKSGIVCIEQVLHDAVELDVVVDPVPGAQVDDCIAR